MSNARIERTSIWKNTLNEQQNDEFKNERGRLRSAFWSFRDKIKYLVGQVAVALPELTQHDISHLDALWETASLIVGDDFELTPLEGFILGGTFLIHDSALCFEAFENGREGLRKTIQWKDAFADLKEANNLLEVNELEHQADFITLRSLHAHQAEKLLSIKWKDACSGNELFLLENYDLRVHLGKIIGLIASSHNWDIETVISTFNTQLNVPTGYPREWRIDPIKIALILRCADAAHIDNERAPDFLFALLKRNGVSFNHWKAQNRLAKVDIDQTDEDKSTLLYTSTIDFDEIDSKAWFVAYDAICLVDKELKVCNTFLEKHIGKGFKVNKVKGIESPENLSVYVKARNWQPCSAKVHVGNVERIIHNLGGEMLYGTNSDYLGIVLREMIQNSRDSIKARAVFDKYFEGKILLSIEKDCDSIWITIEDNGIGMSERVLTDVLLDFGTSFWSSNLVQSEFPGLRSSEFKSIGKFGIGFYSIFMLSEQVFVASRNYNTGFHDVRQLKFTNGFSLRPILVKGAPDNFNPLMSTKIRFRLKPNTIPEDFLIEIKTNRLGSVNFMVPFKSYLVALCAGLDVPIFYKEFNGYEIKIHESIDSNSFNIEEWLIRISFVDFQPNATEIKEYIDRNISRLKFIIDKNRILGLAAISTKIENNNQSFLKLDTVGGLAYSVHCRDGDDIIGYIDHTPKSAKREIGDFTASDEIIKAWAKEQLNILINSDINPIERFVASSALCKFKIDPSELALILTNYNGKMEFLSFEELAELSKQVKIAFINSGLGDGHMEIHHEIQQLQGYALIKPIVNSSFLSLKMENRVPANNFSILDCLYKAIIKKGYIPIIEEMRNVGRNKFDMNMTAILISTKT